MAEVIDYPTGKVEPDSLPEPGNQYEAYRLADEFDPPTINFILPDWSMTGLPYKNLSRMSFKPLGAQGDCHGECAITLEFGSRAFPGLATVASIAGAGLYDFYWHLGNHQVHWLWALPGQYAKAAEGAPVVHAIDITEADRAGLAAMET
jgi:hypothetical protein